METPAPDKTRMSALRNLRMLTRYNAWANDRLYDALAKLPESEVLADRGAGSMLKTLNHAFVVDQVWKGHLESRPHGYKALNTPTLPALAELRAAQAGSDAWYQACADALTEAAHDEAIRFAFVDGGAGEMRRGDMLLHVVNHKTYHRGYVAQMLYQTSLKPPTIDITVFLRDAADRMAA